MRLYGAFALAFLCNPLVAQSLQQLEALAAQRLAANDVNGALAIYQKLSEQAPNSAPYHDETGFLLAASNRAGEAVPHFRRAAALNPKMHQAWPADNHTIVRATMPPITPQIAIRVTASEPRQISLLSL